MLHGLKYDFIEDLLINLRLLKPPPAVLAENGVMRYRIGQRKTNKPTVGDVDPDFLNEASFRTNSVQITDQKHFEQHDRIDARTPIILTIQGAAFFRAKRKVNGFIDFSKQVILGNKVFYVDCFGLKFPGWVRPEHIKTFLRNCFIPNSTKKAVDPSLSTASTGPYPAGFSHFEVETVPTYSPRNWGVRFSRKAFIPSLRSWVSKERPK